MQKANGLRRKQVNEIVVGSGFSRFTRENVVTVALLSIIYLLWIVFAVGMREDHLMLLSVCITMYFASEGSRKFLICIIPFITYWVLYDSMRVCPNYLINAVHIIEPYEAEKWLFGITTPEGILTPNEYFKNFNSTFLDVLSGIFYLCWIPVPLAFASYLFFKDRPLAVQFFLVFLMVNIIGMMIYYLYPAAPPWYVELYGFEENFNIPGNTAGLAKFDDFFGISLFGGMYEKNANVFAAIPSLHAAFPVVLLYFGIKHGLKWGALFFLIIVIGIWFAAVYTQHHYFIDVIIGGMTSAAAIILFSSMLKNKTFLNWVNQYIKLVS